MKNSAEKILESVPRQKEIVDKAGILLADLNPVFKQKKENEERFSKMESSISRLEQTIASFINSFNKTDNTAQ